MTQHCTVIDDEKIIVRVVCIPDDARMVDRDYKWLGEEAPLAPTAGMIHVVRYTCRVLPNRSHVLTRYNTTEVLDTLGNWRGAQAAALVPDDCWHAAAR